MRIDRIQIEGFGQLREVRLDLSPGLNVIHGPNEAGKSTLLAFVRAALFGFGRRNDPLRFEPAHGPFGGELILSTDAGRLTVRRTGAGRRYEGQLVLRGASGEPFPDSRLKEALGGVSRELFEQVFAFGLDELASFDELSAEGSVSEALFAAGMSGAHRLPQAVATLEKSCEALFGKKGTTKPIPAALTRLAEVRDRLRALGDRPLEYFAGIERLRTFEGSVAEAEEEERALHARRDRACRLMAAAPMVAERAALQKALEGLPATLDRFPEAGVARLMEATARLEKSLAERQRLERTAESILRALGDSEVPQSLRAAQSRLPETLAAFQARLELFRTLPTRRQQQEARHRHLAEALAGLGLGLTLEELQRLELGGAARAQLATLRQDFARAHEEQRAREEALRLAEAAVGRVSEELQRLNDEVKRLPSRPEARVKHELEAVEFIPRAQAERLQVATALAERETQRETLTAIDPAPSELFPPWMASVLGALVLALGLGSLIHWGVDRGLPGAAVAAVAALLTLLIAIRSKRQHRLLCDAHRQREEGRGRERSRIEQELESQHKRAAALEDELREAFAFLSLSPDAGREQLRARTEELTRELKGIEQRLRISQAIATQAALLNQARGEEKPARVALQVANARVSSLERSLAERLRSLSFPEGLTVDTAMALCNEAIAIKQRIEDFSESERALAADCADCARVAETLVGEARALGVGSDEPEAAARALAAMIEDVTQRDRQGHQLRAQRQDLESEVEHNRREVESARAALDRLYAQALCEPGDEDRFRKLAAEAEERRRLMDRLREVSIQISAQTADAPDDVEHQLGELGGAQGAAQMLEETERRLKEVERSKQELAEARGALGEQLRQWECDDEAAELRAEEEALTARLERLSRRYAEDRLALSLLQRARERFEQDQQPKVVRNASALFAQLTSYRYARVFISPAHGRSLRVLDENNREWMPEQLSRGTREQLYLAFRIAVIRDFALSRRALPVIVDDVLVNFDPDRAAATLDAFAGLAEGHQVIAFTCHPHLRDAFVKRGAREHSLLSSRAQLEMLRSAS